MIGWSKVVRASGPAPGLVLHEKSVVRVSL